MGILLQDDRDDGVDDGRISRVQSELGQGFNPCPNREVKKGV